ncbi:DUF397 domain-containing protein [Actinomadura decatromicini]|uniref:DUF397 domain-containing protein n=1 Tax=Actinomadura decatromicini TaxID=2604572 RepID=A0A5D3FCH4_9ACTN|nr:DUF397 domain-containing protein [Actinomadura decatromicini]TYK46011.1 DUF397 domain-containing protein [Actinomadura decatromicini]
MATRVWRKASRSTAQGGDCVEVARLSGFIGVRDSQAPDGPRLHITPDAFRALITALKR